MKITNMPFILFVRLVSLVTMICLLVIVYTTGTAKAQEPIKVFIENEEIVFEEPPIIEDGVTLVPFRPLFEKFGLTIQWNETEKKIVGDRFGYTIELALGSTEAKVDGSAFQLAVAPKLINGNTFVPLRFVGEATGYTVLWFEQRNAIRFYESTSSIALGLIYDKLTFESENGRKGGIPEGKGRLLDSEGKIRYEGEFKNGKLDGTGTLYRKEVPYYVGQWRNNKMHGQGKSYKEGKLTYEGSFAEGERNGSGKFFNKSGEPTDVIYENGVMLSKSQLWPRQYSWKTIKTDGFEIYYYDAPEIAQRIAEKVDGIYELVKKSVGHSIQEGKSARIPIFIFSEADYLKEVKSSFSAAVWADGSSIAIRNVNINKVNTLFTTLRHELTHGATLDSKESDLLVVPGWFEEGVAEFEEGTSPHPQEAVMRKLVLENKLLLWKAFKARGSKWDPDLVSTGYAQAWSIWTYLAETYGEKETMNMFFTKGLFAKEIQRVTGKNLEQLEADWTAYVKKKYKKD